MKDFQVLDMKQYYLDRERINHREAWIEQKFSKEKCSNFKFSSRLCNFVFDPLKIIIIALWPTNFTIYP